MPEIEETISLYRFYDKDGDLLYVGQSVDPFARATQHMSSHHDFWFHDVATITIEKIEGREAAKEAELKAISEEGPKYNVIGVVIRNRWEADFPDRAKAIIKDCEDPAMSMNAIAKKYGITNATLRRNWSAELQDAGKMKRT